MACKNTGVPKSNPYSSHHSTLTLLLLQEAEGSMYMCINKATPFLPSFLSFFLSSFFLKKYFKSQCMKIQGTNHWGCYGNDRGQECPLKGTNCGGCASFLSKCLIRVPRLGLHLFHLPQSNLIEWCPRYGMLLSGQEGKLILSITAFAFLRVWRCARCSSN